MNICDNKQWLAWCDAAKGQAVDCAIRDLYADLDAAVAARGPVCNASGRCCRFEEYGHRLYVTGLEIAWFIKAVRSKEIGVGREHDATPSISRPASTGMSLQQLAPTADPQLLTPDCCPYQIDGLCSTHTIRPLGCRVFFCEAGTEDWQQDTTERFLDRLKALHVEHGLPYAYMEWRAGLAEAARVLAIE